jgi:VWFA-related protein
MQDQGHTVGVDPGFDAAQSARLGVILQRAKSTGREPIMGLGGPLAQGMVKNNQTIPGANPGSLGGPAMTLSPPREFHTLNDAIFAAAQQTTKAGKGRKRVVYVISDGKEYGSQIKQKDVIKYCQTHNIQVYATLVGDSSIPGLGFLDRVHLPLTMREDILPKYSAATGGQVDPEFRQHGIESSFAKISEEVRTQYTLGYYSHEPAIDGRFRKVEVRVLRPNLTVIAKDGYYPTPQSSMASSPTAP